jgi:hypothetical protein
MADSGNILATERPFPVQNASKPPSVYIRAMEEAMAFTPRKLGFEEICVPPISGGRVTKKTLSRSNGAVHVRETRTKPSLNVFRNTKVILTSASYASS